MKICTGTRALPASGCVAFIALALTACGSDDGPAPIVPTPVAQAVVTADWNSVSLQARTQLEATAGAQIDPHYEARGLGMSNAVIHDVLNAIDRRYASYAFVATQKDASPDAAVAQAAHDVMVANTTLIADFPSGSQKAYLDGALATDLAKIADGPAKTSGITLGQAAASYYIQLRASDAVHMAPFGPSREGNGTLAGKYQYTVPLSCAGCSKSDHPHVMACRRFSTKSIAHRSDSHRRRFGTRPARASAAVDEFHDRVSSALDRHSCPQIPT